MANPENMPASKVPAGLKFAGVDRPTIFGRFFLGTACVTGHTPFLHACTHPYPVKVLTEAAQSLLISMMTSCEARVQLLQQFSPQRGQHH
ncbi:hypothetical protein E2C01_050154 [Portunus trituberculatus]|uniref:Uncharacterized protein n=1 Tax=Portunus trituberculatus TaxID=210409 RepID=A0A5B7G887_PORTR|nr:hypothetical protein [Portunus trituberculatus]